MKAGKTVALVGNPNCGKTTLFNALTGARQKVGNWPGVTVERKSGSITHADRKVEVVDLPGIYSLHVSREEDSMDYRVAQQYILSSAPDLLINIIDAASIERGLFLTTQLLDANMPMVVVLNMIDIADQQGMHVDPYTLSKTLGCPVVPMVASRSEGIRALLDVVENSLDKAIPSHVYVPQSERIEEAIQHVSTILADFQQSTSRLKALTILENDKGIIQQLPDAARTAIIQDVRKFDDDTPLTEQLISARYQWIDEQTGKAIRREEKHTHKATEFLDALFLNRWLAFPMFLLMNYLMFMFTIHIGSAFIDVFDQVAGAIFVELPRSLLESINTPAFITTLLADGLGGGIQLVASFIPVIACLFLFLAVLEDSGYMARAAFIIDRLLRTIGLPGKSFVPLIVGFGCNVPSVLGARTLSSEQDRILTILMAPYMSCGARLTVYALFAAAFFPTGGQNVIFALYLLGIVLAVLTGLIVKRLVFTAEQSPFILELPPYHLPTIRSVLIHTWQRLQGFVVRAGRAIITVVVVLNFVNSIGVDGSFGNENTEKSALSKAGQAITPIFSPMGVKEDNWPATVGIFTGLFAKEVVVGTLDALYSDMAHSRNGGTANDEPFNLWGSIKAALATVPENLAAIRNSLTDPLGINIGDVSNVETAAAEQDVQVNTITLMRNLFDGPLAAFAYLVFILLYFPCVATLGAIQKEAGNGWAFFSGAWSLTLAYSSAVIIYQAGQLGSHTSSATSWIIAMLVAAAGCIAALLLYARRQSRKSGLIPLVNLS